MSERRRASGHPGLCHLIVSRDRRKTPEVTIAVKSLEDAATRIRWRSLLMLCNQRSKIPQRIERISGVWIHTTGMPAGVPKTQLIAVPLIIGIGFPVDARFLIGPILSKRSGIALFRDPSISFQSAGAGVIAAMPPSVAAVSHVQQPVHPLDVLVIELVDNVVLDTAVVAVAVIET